MNCTDAGDGTEDCDWTLECQVAGDPTNKIVADADGSVTITALAATDATFITPALGTPSAGVLTSCTGLPIATGVSGLGANVATFLATPSSANLAGAVTGATGTGAAVFGTTPTLTTPVLNGATGTSLTLTGNLQGLLTPVEDADGNAAMAAADCAGQAYYNTGANTYILPTAAAGLNCCFFADSAHAVTVRPHQTSSDLIWYGGVSCGTADVAGDDIVSAATVGSFICIHAKDATDWMAWGTANTWTCE